MRELHKPALRVNGRAPAWPVLMEDPHPYYPNPTPEATGSVSYSLLGENWELLIDAGHNTVPFLLNHGNRLPEAILLTHGHPDHILGLDWVAQSYVRKRGKPIPVYCSMGTYEMVMHSYPHLEKVIKHHPLLPGEFISIEQVSQVQVAAFPVFHGSGARGASMLYFRFPGVCSETLLITGDLLCPLLRRKDVEMLSGTRYMFTDMNSRFPDPGGNHQSFTPRIPGIDAVETKHNHRHNKTAKELTGPHQPFAREVTKAYFNQWMQEAGQHPDLSLSVLELASLIKPVHTGLVHYWGMTDRELYNEELLSENKLLKWTGDEQSARSDSGTRFFTPHVGEIFHICS